MRCNLSNLPSHSEMVERLVDVYNNACQYEKIEGVTWYSNAFSTAAMLHIKYGYKIEQIIEVLSVVSPGTEWTLNSSTLPEKMLSYHLARVTLTTLEWPCYPSNVAKVQQILDGQPGVLRGNKVKAFAKAIGGDTNSVVVDAWIVKLVYNMPEMFWRDTAISSDRMYHNISDAVRDAAMFVGMPSALFQACVWTSYRNQYKGRSRRLRKEKELMLARQSI